jgi:hypothetical protein
MERHYPTGFYPLPSLDRDLTGQPHYCWANARRRSAPRRGRRSGQRGRDGVWPLQKEKGLRTGEEMGKASCQFFNCTVAG